MRKLLHVVVLESSSTWIYASSTRVISKLLHVLVLESSSTWSHGLCIRSPDSLLIDHGSGIRV